jgi:hypothetical protein
MKWLLLGFITLYCASCHPQQEPEAKGSEPASAPDPFVDEGEEMLYEEVWMMDGWQGYMCVVIALKDDEFNYWFLSDVDQRRIRLMGATSRMRSESP